MQKNLSFEPPFFISIGEIIVNTLTIPQRVQVDSTIKYVFISRDSQGEIEFCTIVQNYLYDQYRISRRIFQTVEQFTK